MTTETTTPHPPGATLHLGGEAWAHPSLEPRLIPIEDAIPYPGNLTLSEKAHAIAARLARFTGDDDTMLDEMLEELCDAGHEGDVRWFDNVWSGIYDWADDERVWIDTFRKPTATEGTPA